MRKGFSVEQDRSEDLGKMTRTNFNKSDPLAREIRRQFGSPGMTQYLANLPTFSVEAGLPERLAERLEKGH